MKDWQLGYKAESTPQYQLPYFAFSIERPLAITIKIGVLGYRCITFGILHKSEV